MIDLVVKWYVIIRHTQIINMCLCVRERDVSFHDNITRLVHPNIFYLYLVLNDEIFLVYIYRCYCYWNEPCNKIIIFPCKIIVNYHNKMVTKYSCVFLYNLVARFHSCLIDLACDIKPYLRFSPRRHSGFRFQSTQSPYRCLHTLSYFILSERLSLLYTKHGRMCTYG